MMRTLVRFTKYLLTEIIDFLSKISFLIRKKKMENLTQKRDKLFAIHHVSHLRLKKIAGTSCLISLTTLNSGTRPG